MIEFEALTSEDEEVTRRPSSMAKIYMCEKYSLGLHLHTLITRGPLSYVGRGLLSPGKRYTAHWHWHCL